MLLADKVRVSRQFLRTVRVDLDHRSEMAIRGFVCQDSARSVIGSTCHQIALSGQAAFTWTGPYGSGKSSLAMLFAAFLGGEQKIRTLAGEVLGPEVVGIAKKTLFRVLPAKVRRFNFSAVFGPKPRVASAVG